MNLHRTWLPVLLAGVVFIIILGFWLSRGGAANRAGNDNPRIGNDSAANNVQLEPERAPTAEEYQAAIRGIVQRYESNGDRQAAFDSLVAQRVPGEYRTLHVNLVLLFDSEGYSAEAAAARLQQLRSENPWL